MKRIILLLLTINCTLLYAQEEYPAKSYLQIQDSLFQHLDKTNISTGVLYDRVFSWVELTIHHDVDYLISYSFAKQAWLELELASYSKRNILSLKDVKNIVTQNKLDGKGISIGYIDYDFNSIGSTALDKGALVFGEDSLLYDGEEKTSSYLEQQIIYNLKL